MVSFALDKLWLQPCVSAHEEAVWRTVLESQASRFQYLDHSAASLWALHQSFQGTPSASALRANAYRYNLEASNLFRQSNQTVTEDNWLAVLTFGIAVIIFHLANSQTNDDDSHDYMEVFNILRGTSRMARAVIPYFHRSHLKLYVDNRQKSFRPSLEQDVWRSLDHLDAVIGVGGSRPDVTQACHSAVAVLKNWAKETDAYPRTWAHFLRWPGTVSEEFVKLLSEGNESALLVFVYWCTIMHRSPRRWFMKDWACRDARLATKAMNATWDCLLEWPRSVLGQSHLTTTSSNLEVFDDGPRLDQWGLPNTH
ncbi:hypothetical protein SCARD494_03981 [Seiridium cardinale]